LTISPISESARGVLTALNAMGLDTSSRNLDEHRAALATKPIDEYVDTVFRLANMESAVMTNDPFDNLERPVWFTSAKSDPRFHAALRIDFLLNCWEQAAPRLKEWGYDVSEQLSGPVCTEVRRFLTDWISG
jgi:hypothetical protein